jgi:RimJ/RimL family protein N-acetyltransferase
MLTLKPLATVAQPIDPRIPPEFTALIGTRHPWTSYVAYAADGHAVGACAFKRAPNEERQVEIAYLTFPGFEGRGFGTAMAQSLLMIAVESGEAVSVIARTLKEENASVRICRRLDFAFDGEVMDPDDGLVWQWKKKTGATSRNEKAEAPRDAGV